MRPSTNEAISPVPGACLAIAVVLLMLSSAACRQERAPAPAFTPPDIVAETPAGVRPAWTDEQSFAFATLDTVDSTHRLLDLRGLYRRWIDLIADTSHTYNLEAADFPGRRYVTIADSSRIARDIQANVRITIDTTRTLPLRTVSRYLYAISPARAAMNGRHDFIRQAAAMPFYIINTGDSIVQLPTVGGAALNILEAKDRHGIWRPIEKISRWDCGHVLITMITIPPGQYVMGRVIRYAGPFHTELRLRFRFGWQIVLSAPFAGTIDPRQFESCSPMRDYLGAIPDRQ